MGDPRGEDGEAVGECQDVRAGGRGEVNKTKGPYTVYMYWLVVWNMFYFSIYWE